MNTPQSTRRGTIALVTIGLLVGLAIAAYLTVVKQPRPVPPEPGPQAAADEDSKPPWLRRNIDLQAQVTKYASAHGGATDLSAQFYSNDQLSAHLHLMGPGQFCPLHHHPKGHEFSAIVAGQGFVRTDGPDGLVRTPLKPGDVIISSRGSRHEIGNRSTTDYLAALVISTPRFGGNLYLRETAEPGAEASRILLADEQSRGQRTIPFANWAELLSVSTDSPTELSGGGTQLLVVQRGAGTLVDPSGNHAVQFAAPRLLVIRNAPRLRLVPNADDPVDLYLASFLPSGEAVL